MSTETGSTGTTSTPVLIVGAGPTGACAALELARHGIASTVIDRWEGVYPQPRAVHLDDEVLRVLDRLGVAERFAAISRPGGGLRLVDPGLRVLGEFPRDGVSPTTGFSRASFTLCGCQSFGGRSSGFRRRRSFSFRQFGLQGGDVLGID